MKKILLLIGLVFIYSIFSSRAVELGKRYFILDFSINQINDFSEIIKNNQYGGSLKRIEIAREAIKEIIDEVGSIINLNTKNLETEEFLQYIKKEKEDIKILRLIFNILSKFLLICIWIILLIPVLSLRHLT